ncbi:MAG: hypothetical protein FJZ56_06070 [Chlamydiae bacterium]|nr:hypothetical protein [Chlamydiota bacterium]
MISSLINSFYPKSETSHSETISKNKSLDKQEILLTDSKTQNLNPNILNNNSQETSSSSRPKIKPSQKRLSMHSLRTTGAASNYTSASPFSQTETASSQTTVNNSTNGRLQTIDTYANSTIKHSTTPIGLLPYTIETSHPLAALADVTSTTTKIEIKTPNQQQKEAILDFVRKRKGLENACFPGASTSYSDPQITRVYTTGCSVVTGNSGKNISFDENTKKLLIDRDPEGMLKSSSVYRKQKEMNS